MFAQPSRIDWKIILPSRTFLLHRLLPVVLAAGLLYELLTQATAAASWSAIKTPAANSWMLLLGSLALMPLNWWAEVEKWRSLMRRTGCLSAHTAWKAVLAGVAVSLLTPNRMGEYGGRVLFVPSPHRWFAAGATLLGNLAQAMALLSGGVCGLLWLGSHLDWPGAPWCDGIVPVAFIGLLLLWLFYFSLSYIEPRLHRYRFVKRLKRLVKVDAQLWPEVTRTDLVRQAGWAFFRYLVYCMQYFLLLRYFGIAVGVFDGMAGISLLFLLQTGIPLPLLSGLLARGNLAVALWEQFGAGAAESLAATFGLWIINLILPAFFGTFFLFYVRKAKDSSV